MQGVREGRMRARWATQAPAELAKLQDIISSVRRKSISSLLLPSLSFTYTYIYLYIYLTLDFISLPTRTANFQQCSPSKSRRMRVSTGIIRDPRRWGLPRVVRLGKARREHRQGLKMEAYRSITSEQLVFVYITAGAISAESGKVSC